MVGAAVQRHLDDDTLEDTRKLINAHVARVEVRPAELAIMLAAPVDAATAPSSAVQSPGSDSDQHDGASPAILIIPWTKPPAKRRRDIIGPEQAIRLPASRSERTTVRGSSRRSHVAGHGFLRSKPAPSAASPKSRSARTAAPAMST
jgi:hypothetical protein